MSHINDRKPDYTRDNFPCGMDDPKPMKPVKQSCYILPKPQHDLEKICTELLPKFIHLPPDEAAKAAINYAKALIKELER